MKRYFRDATWAVHVPRDLQERSLRTAGVVAGLRGRLGHEPTIIEIAGDSRLTHNKR